MNPQPQLAEDRQSLWLLTISPAIWMTYFLVSYIAAALWCGPDRDPQAGIAPVQGIIAGTAVVCVAAILFVGYKGWRMHQYGKGEAPHDDDTPEDRHRFLGYATLLLSGLSAIATIFAAVSALLSQTCS